MPSMIENHLRQFIIGRKNVDSFLQVPPKIFLIGNKSDLEGERVVSFEEGQVCVCKHTKVFLFFCFFVFFSILANHKN